MSRNPLAILSPGFNSLEKLFRDFDPVGATRPGHLLQPSLRSLISLMEGGVNDEFPLMARRDTPVFKLDVHESENQYEVRAELPGVKKEDVHVTVEGSQVTVQISEQKEVREEKGNGSWIYQERSGSSMSRSFALKNEVDQDNAEATLNDGILTLVLPKKKATTGNRLLVK